MLKATAAVLFAALLPVAAAQVRGPSMALPFVRGPVAFTSAARGSVTFRGHHGAGVWLGTPLWYGDYTSPQPVESSPQVVVVQPPANELSAPAKLAEPLLIELQDGHYVRFQGDDAAQRGFPAEAEYAKSTPPKPSATVHHSAPEKLAPASLRPVELIYRDGHHMDVDQYTIMDGTIFVSGDYWTDGYWQKKIQISSLNLPATIKANQQHGVKFVLPTSPNEVVTRP